MDENIPIEYRNDPSAPFNRPPFKEEKEPVELTDDEDARFWTDDDGEEYEY